MKPGRIYQIISGIAGLIFAVIMAALNVNLSHWVQVGLVAVFSLVLIVGLGEDDK
jgi:hypothetical protein